ncbi:MAG TPA: bifunctional tRNA (5-methylaminomethyl-2-thiouridine)(34)-methyltransferase MnmD/FAD-dependent 5-carboxymethylaminomethyl-2-thiouridine(34) oxidoreductase MnmC [Pseudomonadales bacterium]|nr:bifunctional tRNA (5-methylaminomethyl-2-thiouridine)(34)-methyltransferase MnmD/FAD-dependent 5-carboxymethylaminomethyl-2-thiouridine(34) oxidoreductase MnmC [Pseudomonadales bacterium]
MNKLQPITPAQLRWNGDTPEAAQFGDIYFSRENGLEESRYVFLNGNRLRERWQQLPEKTAFVIGETGFGTGLNFLLAWQLWQQTAPSDAQLFFISTELFPLTRDDLERALAFWPELAPLATQLLQQYPSLTPGFHWLRFTDSRVTLLLLLGDANETLPQLNARTVDARTVDAWFLDGFAPAKNPQLWQQDLLQQIASLSKPGATLATFTAAGQVRRELTALGFNVEKISGYGSKREMIIAGFTEPAQKNTAPSETPWLLHKTTQNIPSHVAMIGAGLAGCHAARALAERGVHVCVYEQHAKAAQEASGNPQGALYTKLSANAAALSRFSLASYQYATRHYQNAYLKNSVHTCGLLQLQDACDEQLQEFFAGNPELLHWVDTEQAIEKTGINMTRGGWWLPQAGWIDPQALCNMLLDHPLISTHFNTGIETLQDIAVTETQHVVITCSNHSARFTETSWLPLRPVRGQITTLPATDTSHQLRCVICDEGYLTPATNNQHCIGASFIPGDTDTTLRVEEQQHNLSLLTDVSAALAEEWQHVEVQGRAALRCTTPDHLPMIGPLPDRDIFLRDYAELRHNAKAVIATLGSYIEGRWILTGFGGRGLCYIPLAAELLASQILQQPHPLPRNIQAALAPARFIIRELIRTHAGR